MSFRSSSRVLLILSLLPLAGCAASGAVLGSLGMEFGKNLMGTAQENYSGDYPAEMETMLLALASDGNLDAATLSMLASGPPIALDVAVLRETVVDGVSVPTPIPNGTTLTDGRGVEGAGDNLKISFEPSIDCYVYVIAVDGSGWAQPLFPSDASSTTNPVAANRQVQIPEGDEWFFLDEYRGVETIYFMASHVPREDLSGIMAELAKNERPALPPAEAVAVTEAAVVERGIAGRRQGKGSTATMSSGAIATFNPTSFLSQQGSADMVVTRWFNHR